MRIKSIQRFLCANDIDAALIFNEANILSLTGIKCDNACLLVKSRDFLFFTDFRYIPEVRRLRSDIKVRDIKRLYSNFPKASKIGFEPSISYGRFLQMKKAFPKAEFIDISDVISDLRSVKTSDEIDRIRRAEALNVEIFNSAISLFSPGMTEREMALIIKRMMIERAEGEAFETIVCVGANAAECHHRPDDTVWNGRESVLIDLGLKLDGVCSDLTRNILPKRPSKLYKKVYDVVLEANRSAIKAARPGISTKALDKIARDVITKAGFGKCFGHSLGHGVGYEIHESPTLSKRFNTILKPGMIVTIEPGIYLEGNLGVRIEDLILITEDGCEVLS